MNRLYLVTRSDLPPGAQAVQASHAMRQFQAEYPEVERQWFETSNTLVLLSVPNEQSLARLLYKATDRDIKASAFREPDLSNALTAVALEPDGAKLVRNLPLALNS